MEWTWKMEIYVSDICFNINCNGNFLVKLDQDCFHSLLAAFQSCQKKKKKERARNITCIVKSYLAHIVNFFK